MEHTMLIIAIAAYVLWNFITFMLYAIDKSRAKRNKWRISEATLIAVAFFMGGVGAWLGMSLLRHKTQHIKFKLLVPLATVINIGILVLIYLLF